MYRRNNCCCLQPAHKFKFMQALFFSRKKMCKSFLNALFTSTYSRRLIDKEINLFICMLNYLWIESMRIYIIFREYTIFFLLFLIMHNVLKYDSCTAQYLVLEKRIFMFLILYYISCLLKSQLLWNSQKKWKNSWNQITKKNHFWSQTL